MFTRPIAIGLAIAASALAPAALGQHQDVSLGVDASGISILNGISTADGAHLYEASFGELGAPFGTDDPGFIIDSGGMNPNEILAYSVTAPLEYWDGACWSDAVPVDERVVITDIIDQQTFITTADVTSPNGFVDAANSAGGIHTHIDFEVESAGTAADPSTGAYLIEFSLFGLASDQVTQVYPNTAPIRIAFNMDLPDADFELAVDALLNDPDTDGDGVNDSVDNCTLVGNADQLDTDGDGFGNLCDTDLNNDGVTNPIDLGLFRSVFFTADPDADFNGDGIVNTVDLGILRLYFFEMPGPAAECS